MNYEKLFASLAEKRNNIDKKANELKALENMLIKKETLHIPFELEYKDHDHVQAILFDKDPRNNNWRLMARLRNPDLSITTKAVAETKLDQKLQIYDLMQEFIDAYTEFIHKE